MHQRKLQVCSAQVQGRSGEWRSSPLPLCEGESDACTSANCRFAAPRCRGVQASGARARFPCVKGNERCRAPTRAQVQNARYAAHRRKRVQASGARARFSYANYIMCRAQAQACTAPLADRRRGVRNRRAARCRGGAGYHMRDRRGHAAKTCGTHAQACTGEWRLSPLPDASAGASCVEQSAGASVHKRVTREPIPTRCKGTGAGVYSTTRG